MATRPDLIPKSFCNEFKKLHDQVPAAPFSVIEQTLRDHFDCDLKTIFDSIDEVPIGAASIAQVYKAVLKNGEHVVVKVQRAGIEEVVAEDLSVLFRLSELMEKYLPETRNYSPIRIVEEFRRHIEFETNFVVEANNIRRFAENFAEEPNIHIPKIYSEFTGRRVLVMEEVLGIPLSHKNALAQEGIDAEVVLRRGLHAYLKMVFRDGLFHGDLHAGNLFIMPNNKIGLIDFGVVGRLKASTQSAIAVLLMALYDEDYEYFATTYMDLAPFSEKVDVDAFARDLQDYIAPYFGMTLSQVNVGRLLMESTTVAARHGLKLPPELLLFFKSITTIEGMARILMTDFDFLATSMEFAREIVLEKAQPQQWVNDLTLISRDLKLLAWPLPRQLRQLFRRWSQPEHAIRIEWVAQEELRRSLITASQKIFLALIVAALLISSSIMASQAVPWEYVIAGFVISLLLALFGYFRG